MIATQNQPMTLAEYLQYNDGTDNPYELVNGELHSMPSESDLNNLIAIVLLAEFLQFLPPRLLRRGSEIVIAGTRATTRIPDLMVLSDELAAALVGSTRSIVMVDMPPPALVVEVVSPGTSNEERDYRYKRSEYAARGIAEYWVVDPIQRRVTVFTLVAGFYEEAVFQGGDRILSPLLPNLDLTPDRIWQVGAVA